MKLALIAATCLMAVSACATNQSGMSTDIAAAPHNEGAVTVAGLSASEALGAIDTKKLVGATPQQVTANQPAQVGAAETTEGTGNAIAVEGVTPAAVLAAIDPTKLVASASKDQAASTDRAPEVQAVVDSGKRYTTKDLASAQLEAVRNGAPG